MQNETRIKLKHLIYPPGVDVHAEDSPTDEVELDEVAEDEATKAKVQEPLKERCARQHGLHVPVCACMHVCAQQCEQSALNKI